MSRTEERLVAVSAAMARVRRLASEGVTRDSLTAMERALKDLAVRRDLFDLESFPPPKEEDEKNYKLYRLSEDQDHGFALYLQICHGCIDVPPHNHNTWAVIAGIDGIEQNRFYERREEGALETGRKDIGPGEAVSFLGEDLHFHPPRRCPAGSEFSHVRAGARPLGGPGILEPEGKRLEKLSPGAGISSTGETDDRPPICGSGESAGPGDQASWHCWTFGKRKPSPRGTCSMGALFL